jgi:predicted ABC-type ATPase
MLHRIKELLEQQKDFAFETTLATKSYVSFVKKAQAEGYEVTLLYFWLNTPQMAVDRVAKRVSQGGHNIPKEVIERRYFRGINNLLTLYIPICDNWLVIDNMDLIPEIVAQGTSSLGEVIINKDIWTIILSQSHAS